jgi:hypothetical protein
MVVEARRYLADTLTVRLHDADHELPACGLGELRTENRRWYDAIGEAMAEAPYEPCPSCLGVAERSLAGGLRASPSRST